jgi:hypothetical protein
VCSVLFECGVIFFAWYVHLCVLCLTVVPLPPGINPFTVQLHNNNNNNKVRGLLAKYIFHANNQHVFRMRECSVIIPTQVKYQGLHKMGKMWCGMSSQLLCLYVGYVTKMGSSVQSVYFRFLWKIFTNMTDWCVGAVMDNYNHNYYHHHHYHQGFRLVGLFRVTPAKFSRNGLSILLSVSLSFTSAYHPNWLWDPFNLLTNGYLGAFSQGVKRQRREADHSPPTSAEVTKTWIYISTPPIRLHGAVLN